MALNKIERELLQEAARRIATQRERYICLALLDVSLDRQVKLIAARRSIEVVKTRRAYRRLRDYIMAMLQGHGSLGGWSVRRGLPTEEGALRASRLAWISWMLREEGD
jgi:hypothetical protein